MKNRILVILRNRISVSFACILWQILVLVACTNGTQASKDLLFFRATENKGTYTKNPCKYDRVVLPPQSGLEEVYVERLPSLRLRITEIISVVIEREKVHADLQKTIDELSGIKTKGKEGEKESNTNYVYKATLYLNEQGAKRFKDFANKHDREIFDLRLQTRRLSLIKFLGPFSGNFYSTYLEEDDIGRIKELLSSINDKVTWR